MKQFTFGLKKSFDDYNLALSSYEIGSPEVRTVYVEVPGFDGSLDMTEAISDRPLYSNRSLTADFILFPPRTDWELLASTARSELHGQRHKVYEPDDLDHYYVGRLSVGTLTRDGVIASIQITGTFDPYKYKRDETVVSMVSVVTPTEVVLINADKPAVPVITTSGSIIVTHGANSFALDAGSHQVAIVLYKGSNSLTVAGAATVTFSYQEGVL